MRVLSVEEAHPDFHPRYDAIAKTYEYRIHRAETLSPFEWRYTHHFPYPLNEQVFAAFAPLLEGEHDFSAFAASDDSDHEGKSMVRTIFSSQARRTGDSLVYEVRGSGFLKHMVRNIVGVLLEAGKGNLCEADVRALLLDPRHRPQSRAATAPSRGLFLVSVEYAALTIKFKVKILSRKAREERKENQDKNLFFFFANFASFARQDFGLGVNRAILRLWIVCILR